ncbi:MAG TPA: hypothetical protein VHD55_01365 [Candidatus Paceibacterota bacterium]|nr:hypothetical protein [Candidatus Paceibacterota bacterium]
MKTSTVIAVVAALLVVGGAYWYWSSGQMALPGTPAADTAGDNGTNDQGVAGQPNTGGTVPAGNTNPTQTNVLAITADATLGQFLTANNGMAVYTYDGDATGVSNCTGSCADTWPPFTVSSSASIKAPDNVSGTVGTIRRADNSLQVTYNGKPLYFYSKDTVAGKASGQGNGGVWFVIKP